MAGVWIMAILINGHPSIFSSVKWVNSKKIVISAVVLVIKPADK